MRVCERKKGEERGRARGRWERERKRVRERVIKKEIHIKPKEESSDIDLQLAATQAWSSTRAKQPTPT